MSDLTPELFDEDPGTGSEKPAPLADRMRPHRLDDILGQGELIGETSPLRRGAQRGSLPSVIFWGPPGCGKTTLARVLSQEIGAEFREVSAVSSGVKDLREVIQLAFINRKRGRRTVLFIDEIHRFNKAQQDAILPAVENGTVTLIGATTENPSFEVNAPLRSRCHVIRLEAIPSEVIRALVERALADTENGLGGTVELTESACDEIVRRSNGDARIALNLLEASVAARAEGTDTVDAEAIALLAKENTVLYDKASGRHYDHASALQKSLRGSDPDAAMYWLAKMLAAGEDPRFIARRILVTAAEDVGLADPRALSVAVAAFQALEFLGLPEARIPLAEAALYVATAPKSNSAIRAIDAATAAIEQEGASHEVPGFLRMAGGDRGEYRYPHVAPGHFLADDYLPRELRGRSFYVPTEMGDEKLLAKRVRGPLGRGRERPEDPGKPPDR